MQAQDWPSSPLVHWAFKPLIVSTLVTLDTLPQLPASLVIPVLDRLLFSLQCPAKESPSTHYVYWDVEQSVNFLEQCTENNARRHTYRRDSVAVLRYAAVLSSMSPTQNPAHHQDNSHNNYPLRDLESQTSSLPPNQKAGDITGRGKENRPSNATKIHEEEGKATRKATLPGSILKQTYFDKMPIAMAPKTTGAELS